MTTRCSTAHSAKKTQPTHNYVYFSWPHFRTLQTRMHLRTSAHRAHRRKNSRVCRRICKKPHRRLIRSIRKKLPPLPPIAIAEGGDSFAPSHKARVNHLQLALPQRRLQAASAPPQVRSQYLQQLLRAQRLPGQDIRQKALQKSSQRISRELQLQANPSPLLTSYHIPA